MSYLPVGIESLINGNIVESTRLEFKSGINYEAIIHTIVAFANDFDNIGGGYIVIGVKDKGYEKEIVGVDASEIDQFERKLLEYCHLIEPLYIPRISIESFDCKNLIVLWCVSGKGRPYVTSKSIFTNRSDKAFYIRKLSSTVVATREQINELYEMSMITPFDEQIHTQATIDDIDKYALRNYLYSVNSKLLPDFDKFDIIDILKALNLIDGPKEYSFIKNVGVLMFAKDPQKFFKYAYIEYVKLPSKSGEEIFEKKFTGPLQDQLNNVFKYIKDNIIEMLIVKKPNEMKAEHFYNYPIEAIEEILVNAVYHRSYKINEPITILDAGNYLEIKSFPGLDTSITDEMIEKYDIKSSKPYRNRSIGAFLKDLNLTEGRNTGIPLALKRLELNASPKPMFIVDKERSSLKVRIFVQSRFKKDTEIVGLNAEKSNEELELEILRYLERANKSANQLAKDIGYKKVSKRFNKILDELIVNNKIKKEGEGKGTKYIKL